MGVFRAPAGFWRLWRPSPFQLSRLTYALALFGIGEGLLVAAHLGSTPWTILAQGLAEQTPLGVGTATTVLGFLCLLIWIPLREVPGLGTLGKAVAIGPLIDLTVMVMPDDLSLAVRWPLVAAGILMVAVGSGYYLTAALGPGPRDGLMTGLHRHAGLPLGKARWLIEGSVLALGFVLGGHLGAATVLFALAIGPGVEISTDRLSTPAWRALTEGPPDAPSTVGLEVLAPARPRGQAPGVSPALDPELAE
jgi:uncharacterized membrane protein YczE